MYHRRLQTLFFYIFMLNGFCLSVSNLNADIYEDLILSQAPTVYWRLGEDSGDNTADNLGSKGSISDGTYGSMVSRNLTGIAPGTTDGAAGFFKSVDSFVADSNFDMGAILTDVSFSFWVQGQDNGLSHFFAFAEEFGSTNGFTVGSNNGDFRLIINGEINDIDGLDVLDGMAHHIGISRDESTGEVKIYVDGELEATESMSSSFVDWLGYFALGQDLDDPLPGYDPAQAFDGTLDEFAIWNRKLTQQEFAAQANIGVPEPSSAMVLGLFSILGWVRKRKNRNR